MVTLPRTASRRVHAASLDDPLCSDGGTAWTSDSHHRDGVVVWIGIT
jgi:hypothetical protein